MDDLIDLDVAVGEIERRVHAWRMAGLAVGPVTWRDRGEGWPPKLKTDRLDVKDADSIGVALRKDEQEGEVVLFKGGWCDLVYWTGVGDDEPVQAVPGYPDRMTINDFGALLDRLVTHFQ